MAFEKMAFKKITSNVFMVGGAEFTSNEDASSYLVNTIDKKLVLIDCGVNSFPKICENIKQTGLNPNDLIALILTHSHIDHIGSAKSFKDKYPKLQIYAHSWDKAVIEGTDFQAEKKTAATWYGITFIPCKIDVELKTIGGSDEIITIGGTEFTFIHTPGHTPGSMAIMITDDKKKVLFGQDIHGPFMDEFDSNIRDWAKSMKILLSKEPDILAEGHFGVFKTKYEAARFIQTHLTQNGFG
jgi:metallo-beta-lactamase class B